MEHVDLNATRVTIGTRLSREGDFRASTKSSCNDLALLRSSLRMQVPFGALIHIFHYTATLIVSFGTEYILSALLPPQPHFYTWISPFRSLNTIIAKDYTVVL